MRSYRREAKVFQALAHPVRLLILDVLGDEEECVCHLMAVTGLRQAYISQQLAVLRDAGLVVDRKDGLNVFYRVRDQRVLEARDLMLQMLREWSGVREEEEVLLSSYRRSSFSCACPKCQAKRQAV